MADEPAVGTPDWWLNRLHKKLQERRPALAVLDSYYTGEQPLQYATESFRAAFRTTLGNLSDNWCGVVVDAVEERLNVQGFRFPTEDEPPEPQPPGDTAAWDIWQRNDLDAGSQMLHTEALINGYANVLVWADDEGKAIITPEHPMQTMVEHVPGTYKTPAAALKEWRDDWTGRILATVYLPNGLYKYISENEYKHGDPGVGSRVRWTRRTVEREEWPLANPLGVVPMVEFCNKPRLLDHADSEIRGIIPLQDAVNKLVADMLVASEFQAFRQRWATGIEVPVNPETNEPIEPFKAAVNRLWMSESPDTQFGEFAQADLRLFTAAVEMLVQHIATQSRTPPHYFYLSGQFPSGESIKSAETGLVAKARRRMTHFSDSWERVIRLSFAVEEDTTRAEAYAAQTIWADPESRSEAEHTDAMVKLKALAVPNEALWERWGFSPQEIERFLAQAQAEAARMPQPPVLVPVAAAPPNGEEPSGG